jgi:tRNA pseudouridine38-40 synthase
MSAASPSTEPPPPLPPLTRWQGLAAYEGTDFSGWQSQPDGNAVQDHLERRLATLLGQPVRVHGSGRTDAGVHARGQVFHFEAAWRHGPERLSAALAAGLPPALQVQTVREVDPAFHARFSATGKIYHYTLLPGGAADPFNRRYVWALPRPLDLGAMQAAAAALRGRRDFRAFSAFGGEERPDTVRDLRRLDLVTEGRTLRVEAEADGFLYKMVRSLVGALVATGQGKLAPERIPALLAARVREPVIGTAPAQGLCLMRVFYPPPWDLAPPP